MLAGHVLKQLHSLKNPKTLKINVDILYSVFHDNLFSQCREHFLFGKTQININDDVSHSSYQVRLFTSSPCAPQQDSLAKLEYELQSY